MVQKIITRLTIGFFLLLAGCSITVEPTTLDFGSEEMSKTVEITIQGMLKWTIQSDADWATVSPDHGQTTEEVTVAVDRTGLAPGDYEALLTIVNKWKIPSTPVLIKMSVEEPMTTTTSTNRPPTTTVPPQTTTTAPKTTTVPVTTTTTALITTTVPVTTTTTAPVTTTVLVTTTTTAPVTSTTSVPITTSISTTTTTIIVPPKEIPTLSEWGIIIFMTIIMGIGVVFLLRRKMV